MKSCISRSTAPMNVGYLMSHLVYKDHTGELGNPIFIGDPATAVGMVKQNAVQRVTTATYYDWSGHIAEAFVFLNNGNVLVTNKDNNPILKGLQNAQFAWANSEEFYLKDDEVKSLVQIANTDKYKKPEDQRVHRLRTNKSFVVINKAMLQHPLLRFLFKDKVKEVRDHLLWGGTGSFHDIKVDLLGPTYQMHQAHSGRTFARSAWYLTNEHEDRDVRNMLVNFQVYSRLNYEDENDKFVNLEALLEGVFESASFKVNDKLRKLARDLTESYTNKAKILGPNVTEILANAAWSGREKYQQALDELTNYKPSSTNARATEEDANFIEKLRKTIGMKPEGGRISVYKGNKAYSI